MTDINSVVLTGRLTKDGELKYSQNGTGTLRFTLAFNRAKRNVDGSWSDEGNFIDCVYFGKSAEAISSYLQKGRQITLQGELRQSKWEQDGMARSRIEIIVSNISLGSSPRGDDSQRQGNGTMRTNNQYQNNRQDFQSNGFSGQGNGYRSNVERPTDRVFNSNQNGPEEFKDDDIPF